MIWDAFAGGQKSQLVFMPKDRCSPKDFVEVVYNVELLYFMSRVPQGLLMEDGKPVHCCERSFGSVCGTVKGPTCRRS